jgi:UDP-N-acetylmuramyl tripeptide synthase
VANVAGAALAAQGLGISAALIAAVLSRFGARNQDNPGRLMRFARAGVTILLDYAHNPDGLRGLLSVATQQRATGRLGLILGHAGNRTDEDIRSLAQVAAAFQPDLVVIKENEAHLRGRAAGEIPALLRDELLKAGLSAARLPILPSELAAARHAMEWARPGDVLVLPIHALAARQQVLELLGESA